MLILLLLSITLATCDNFVIYDELDAASSGLGAGQGQDNGGGSPPSELSISPASVVIEKNRTIDFDASGGEPEYLFALTSGDGSIESDTGLYTAPNAAGSATIRVTDGAGATAQATVTILDSGSSALQISPISVSIETNQTLDFAASGGVPEYAFSVVSGGGSVESDTGLYTAPAVAGSATVRVEDASGAFADAEVTVLDSAPPPLVIVPATTAVKVTETIGFAASGGHGGYIFSIESGGGSIEAVSGLYTAPSSAGGATVRVTDAGGLTAEASVTILVPADLRIYPETVTVNINGTYTFTAAGGTTNYTFSIENSQTDAQMNGPIYTARSDPGTDIIRVVDDGGGQAFASVQVVGSGPLVITPTHPRVQEEGSLQFTGAGGTPPYSFSLVSGAGTGTIVSGVYTAPATVGIGISEIEITDDNSATATTLVDVVPKAPTNLVAAGIGGGPPTIELTWEDNSASEDGYRVERRTSGGSYGQIADLPADSTSHTDSGVTPTTLYIYRVYAYTDDPLQSEYSNEGFDVP